MDSYAGIEIVHETDHREQLAQFAQRVRDWLAESAMSERITRKRCRELLALCDEFDPYFPPV